MIVNSYTGATHNVLARRMLAGPIMENNDANFNILSIVARYSRKHLDAL